MPADLFFSGLCLFESAWSQTSKRVDLFQCLRCLLCTHCCNKSRKYGDISTLMTEDGIAGTYHLMEMLSVHFELRFRGLCEPNSKYAVFLLCVLLWRILISRKFFLNPPGNGGYSKNTQKGTAGPLNFEVKRLGFISI